MLILMHENNKVINEQFNCIKLVLLEVPVSVHQLPMNHTNGKFLHVPQQNHV